MIHVSLPQTMTPEALGKWIVENKKDTIFHRETFPLTEEEIKNLEHQSSAASRALDRLKAVEDLFKSYMKNGTPCQRVEKELVYDPIDITIPPTKGTKALKSNREYADNLLEAGERTETTDLYLVPWPEEAKMVCVDIEGQEWSQYTRAMTTFEINENKPLLKEDKVKKGKKGKNLTSGDWALKNVHIENNTVIVDPQSDIPTPAFRQMEIADLPVTEERDIVEEDKEEDEPFI